MYQVNANEKDKVENYTWSRIRKEWQNSRQPFFATYV